MKNKALFIKQVNAAVNVLKKGGVILYPTDTVWGIGCDATNETAVTRVFQIKQRSMTKNFIVLVDSIEMASAYLAEMPSAARQMIMQTDKPQTVVFQNAHGLARNLIGVDDSIAMRWPQHQFCLEVLRLFKKPIVSTSANIAGAPTPLYFSDISDVIKNQMDWIASTHVEGESTHSASNVVAVDMNNQIVILRG